MAFIRCPRCELNFMREDEQLCSVCRRELQGDLQEDTYELCSICGENPVMPGRDVCYACHKEMMQQDEDQEEEEEEEEESQDIEIDMENVADMEELEVDEIPDDIPEDIGEQISLEEERSREEREAEEEDKEDE